MPEPPENSQSPPISDSDISRDPLAPAFSAAPEAVPGSTSHKPQIEGYRIIGDKPMAESGMGVVWRAVQLSTRREVALKLIAAAYIGSEQMRRRFEREVELAASLDHSHIARVYDSGLHQGVYYYAMQLIDGVHLDQYVRENGLTRRHTLQLICTICRALQYAHQHGVIHTDLKPSNIVVTKNGEPFVLDFGLAKSIGGTDTLSRPGMVAGTIPYMSPEQAAGHRDTLDMSTDVYSLGVMLFELLTGQSPRNRTDDAQEMLRRIREEPVKRPRKLSKEVDAEIEALLLKALRDEPANRYRNAGDLADDIDNYLIGEPLTAKAPSTAYLLRKRAWKHRVPVTLAIAVVVILSVMASLNYYRFARTTTDFVHANNRSTATVAAELVARDLEQALSLAQSYAAFAGMIESVEQHDAQAVRDRLQALVKSNARIDHAAVFDPDGNMWSDYPPAEGALGKNFRNYRWYRHRAQGWKTAYISEVYRRIEEPRVLVVAANAPIFNRQQEVIGALTCQYRIEQITEWLKQIKLGQSGYVFALDHNGAVTAHPQIDLQSRVPGDYRYAGLPSVKRAVQGEASTVIYTDPVAKREMVATFMPVKVWPWNWVVVSQQPVDEAFAAVHQLRLQIIITFCILAAVAVVVVVALAWSSRPRFPAARSST